MKNQLEKTFGKQQIKAVSKKKKGKKGKKGKKNNEEEKVNDDQDQSSHIIDILEKEIATD